MPHISTADIAHFLATNGIALVALVFSIWNLYLQQFKLFSLFANVSPKVYVRYELFDVRRREVVEHRTDCFLIATVNVTNRGVRGGLIHLLALRITYMENDHPCWVFFSHAFLKPTHRHHPSLIDPVTEAEADFTPIYLASKESTQFLMSFLCPFNREEARFRARPGTYRGELLCSTDGEKWRVKQSFHFGVNDEVARQQDEFDGFQLETDQHTILRGKLLSSEADETWV